LQIRPHRFDSGRRLQISDRASVAAPKFGGTGGGVDRVGIGVIGCGNISGAYLGASRLFPVLDVRAVADADPAAARRRGQEFGVPAVEVGELLADPGIEIVVNLTVPGAHAAVGREILAAGKHAYSEKPLATSFAEGKALIEEAERLGLRVGCAPDTFLGGAHQAAREFLDAGRMGEVVGGTAFFMCPGHERWHPNPDFYYKAGGGPVLDMAPYYLTQLVNLLGPVARVAAMAPEPRAERTITSAPRAGERIAVEVPTHVSGTLQFRSGAVVGVTMSFDVAGHRHLPLEIYGTEGSLVVPDPNWFGGEVSFLAKGGEWEAVPVTRPWTEGQLRSLGVADMAAAIRQGRPHRASGALALHVLEVMEGLGRSAEAGAFVEMATRPERPRPLAEDPGLDGR
jgi:predicted dehydrogenase